MKNKITPAEITPADLASEIKAKIAFSIMLSTYKKRGALISVEKIKRKLAPAFLIIGLFASCYAPHIAGKPGIITEVRDNPKNDTLITKRWVWGNAKHFQERKDYRARKNSKSAIVNN